MKKLLFTLLLSLLAINVYSQRVDSTKSSISKHHLGFHIGSTTGLGISYRYWHNRIGAQVTTMPFISKDNGNFYSLGLSFLYVLKDNKKADLIGYIGNHFLSIDTKLNYNLGLGIGLKVDFFEVLDFSLQAGYGIYNLQDSPSSLPTGEIGLYYHL